MRYFFITAFLSILIVGCSNADKVIDFFGCNSQKLKEDNAINDPNIYTKEAKIEIVKEENNKKEHNISIEIKGHEEGDGNAEMSVSNYSIEPKDVNQNKKVNDTNNERYEIYPGNLSSNKREDTGSRGLMTLLSACILILIFFFIRRFCRR